MFYSWLSSYTTVHSDTHAVFQAAHTRAHEWLTHYRKTADALPICSALLWRALDAQEEVSGRLHG